MSSFFQAKGIAIRTTVIEKANDHGYAASWFVGFLTSMQFLIQWTEVFLHVFINCYISPPFRDQCNETCVLKNSTEQSSMSSCLPTVCESKHIVM